MKDNTARIQSEICKLCAKNFEVVNVNGNPRDLEIVISGPADTPFYGNKYKIRIGIPPEYPFKSPSIGFITKIFHPNIDEVSGTVCLDVLNQVWSPLFDLCNVVEAFLPQLLAYPNPLDPLNTEAAHMFINDKKRFNETVKEYAEIHCETSTNGVKVEEVNNGHESSSESIEI